MYPTVGLLFTSRMFTVPIDSTNPHEGAATAILRPSLAYTIGTAARSHRPAASLNQCACATNGPQEQIPGTNFEEKYFARWEWHRAARGIAG